MDLAPIHTIHGFCQRALGEHALEAGQPLRERELLENEAALRRGSRRSISGASIRATRRCAATLGELWSSPEALAESLRELVVLDVLQPAPRADDGSADAAHDGCAQGAGRGVPRAWRGTRARLLRKALAEGSVNKTVVKDEAVDPVWIALDEWLQTSCERDPATIRLENFASDRLQAKTNKPASPRRCRRCSTPSQIWQQLPAASRSVPARERRHRHRALRRATSRRQRFDALKRERGLQGFDDLIHGVRRGARRPRTASAGATACARSTRSPWSTNSRTPTRGSGRSSTACSRGTGRRVAPRALFLIGDPKQAIYRFRGGDVFTYLAAAKQVDAGSPWPQLPLAAACCWQALQALFELARRRCVRAGRHPLRAVTRAASCRDDDLRSTASRRRH